MGEESPKPKQGNFTSSGHSWQVRKITWSVAECSSTIAELRPFVGDRPKRAHRQGWMAKARPGRSPATPQAWGTDRTDL